MRTIYLLLLFLSSLISFSQNAKIEALQKDYDFKEKKKGFIILKDKKNSENIKIANVDGEIIYSYKNNEKNGFLSGLKCGKFFTAKIKGSGNDGGGYTIFEYVDVEIHDVKNPNVGVKTNFNFTNRSGQQLFEFYNFFDTNDKVGIVNSCGEIIVPAKYNRISNFNEFGQALAYTETDFTVIDTLGKSILKQPFKHGQERIYKNSFEYEDEIKDNRVKSSLDGKQFGIFDIKENKQLIPNIYDEISPLDRIYYSVTKQNKKSDFAYLAKKSKIIEVIGYSDFKPILPMSLGADWVSSITELNNKYLIIFSKRKEIIKQVSPSVKNDESKSFMNIYYDGKVLFDPKIEIKDIVIYRDRFITLHLHNGGSKIYDFEKSKFIADFPNKLITLRDYESIARDLTYDAKNELFNVIIPCKGQDCQTANSTRGALCDYNGNLKTDFLLDVSYIIVKPDKNQNKLFFLTRKRPVNFVLNYNLYNNDGKLILENFNISDNQKEYSFTTNSNILVLNEVIENTSVYGKTAFDIDGKMIGERYMYISEPAKKQEVKNNYTKEQLESQKNNRFLKK